MSAVLAYGVHLPHHRLERSAIGQTLGSGGGSGSRTVASYDEDTTSMGVEAARHALRGLPAGAPAPTALFFATSDPPYLEKCNASALHAALGLDRSVAAYDVGGAVRSGIGALRLALERAGTTLVVLSDLRGGLPGGADESAAGDAAAAFVIGPSADGAIADFVAAGCATTEVLDRWRLPGEPSSRSWEDRFGEAALADPGQAAVDDALKAAGLSGVDVAGVACASWRVISSVAKSLANRGARLVDGLEGSVGYAGAAHAGLLLVAALEAAGAGEVVAVAAVADGADVLLFRASGTAPAAESLAFQVARGGRPIPYPTFLTWRGHLVREPPRRPDNERPDAPAALRAGGWKFAFVGSRCLTCDRRHLPPQRVCVECGLVDQMRPDRVADCEGTVVTFTVDRVSYSIHPPVIAAVIEFEGGGRFQCELTDTDPDEVHVGLRVRTTFRRMYTAQGVHNYFWKVTPVRSG